MFIINTSLKQVARVTEVGPNGATIYAMTFQGSVPGPIIVVHENDFVELTLVNPKTNSLPHNIGEQDYYLPTDDDGDYKRYSSPIAGFADMQEVMATLTPTHVVFNGAVGALTGDKSGNMVRSGRLGSGNDDIQTKMRVLRRLGHPYTDAEIKAAPAELEGLMDIDALIAYLQALGTSKNPEDTP